MRSIARWLMHAADHKSLQAEATTCTPGAWTSRGFFTNHIANRLAQMCIAVLQLCCLCDFQWSRCWAGA